MNTQSNFLTDEELRLMAPVPNPTEIIEGEDTVTFIYRPEPRFRDWFVLVDSHIQDMTGYSVTSFYKYPTFETWADWADDPQEAALEVLNQDVWGQEFLLSYHSEDDAE